MNTADPDSPVTPVPSAPRRSRWRRVLAVGLWGLISLIVLIAVAWQWINWNGARRLAAAKAKVEAAGETLNIHKVLPDPVPDELNFCAVPALKDLALVVKDGDSGGDPERKRQRLKKLGLPFERKDKPQPALRGENQPLNTKAWLEWLGIESEENANEARLLMQALELDSDLEEELAAALDRPQAQWTPHWKDRESFEPWTLSLSSCLPHLLSLRGIPEFWLLRASSAAHAGDTKTALHCIRIMMRFSEASATDASVFSSMIAILYHLYGMEAIWQAGHERLCTAEEWGLLERELRQIDIPSASLHTYRTELCLLVEAFEWMRVRGLRNSWGDVFGGETPWYAALIPPGWLDINAAMVLEMHLQEVILPLKNTVQITLPSSELKTARRTKLNRLRWSGGWFAELVLDNHFSILDEFVYWKAKQDLCILACALERQALLHGAYPAALGELSLADNLPAPVDPFTSKAYRYERTENGRYRLWSSGPDGKDGEGDDDLIWEYP